MNPEAEAILLRSQFVHFLPKGQYEVLRPLFQVQRHEFGDVIVREGEPADAFFVLTLGRARVVKRTEKGGEISLQVLHPGDEFGETALLSGSTRNASVRCSTAVEVLRLDRAELLRLAERFPELKTHLELRKRWKVLHTFLYEYSNFGRLPASALHALLEKLAPMEFAAGELIIREGDPAGPMYIIREGRVRVFAESGHQAANRAFLREGDFFGELSMLRGTPRAASVVAVSPCALLALPPEAVAELNRSYSEFAALLNERLAQYEAPQEARVPLDFLVETIPAPAQAAALRQPDRSWGTPPAESEPAISEVRDEDSPFADWPTSTRRPGKTRRVPLVHQIDEADCGPACLAMVCRYFGRRVSLARIRQLCHTSTDGTSLKAICHAAVELGLAARALKVSHRNLNRMPLPAIVHWEGNHWLVLLAVGERHIRVADPALGARRLPRGEFEQKWSGYAALFDYTQRFEQAPEGQTTLGWLVPFLAQHTPTLGQVLLLSTVASSLLLALPVFTQVLVDKVMVMQDQGLLNIVILGLLLTQGFLLAASLLQQYLISFVAVRLDTNVLDALTRQLLSLPMSYFNNRRTGDIQRRLEGVREVRETVIQQSVGGLLSLVQIVGSAVLMAAYSPRLLVVFLATAPLYLALMGYSRKVLRPLYADLEESQGRYSSQQIDALKGIEAVKAAAAEPAFRDRILNEFLSLSRKRFRGQFATLAYQTLSQMVGLFGTTLFLWFGARMVIHAELTVGAFVAFSTLLGLAGSAVLRFLWGWDDWQRAAVLLNRLQDVLEQEPEQGRDRAHLKPVPSLEGQVELRGVGFRYGGPESPAILTDIHLEVAPGRMLGIVGRSGCGKTTLIKLIAGLIEPTEGTIRIDRVDLRTLNYRDLRRRIGLVLQENHIFGDTILRNIAFGDPEPDFDGVLRAAQMANAHDFIMRLPMGYETRIGETGLALSGGQRQRIAIARALYPDPAVLIFDEASSALDSESERAIQKNLTRFLEGRTNIIIAQRLSTIRDADAIVVIDKGRVIEKGTHQELMDARGLYFYLSSQQLGL